jgi:hypothetical protein
MNTQALDMTRKRRTFKLDERLLEALKDVANSSNTSANNWLETLLINTFKKNGAISKDFRPLVENRGGSRTVTEEEVVND